MRNRIVTVWACLLLLVLVAAGLSAAPPAKGVCPVCKVVEGKAEPEPVKATSVYQGETYGFCSKKCKSAFDEDPVAYLPPVLPRPAPAFTVQTLDGKEVAGRGSTGGRYATGS